MLKVAICDDESQFRNIIKKHLSRYQNETSIEIEVFEFENGEDLLEKNIEVFDVILLDIRMNKLNGIEVAKQIRSKDSNTVIVFITSLIQYALEGYKINAIDYLLKPINYKNMEDIMNRIIQKLETTDYITIKNDNGVYKIAFSDIVFIETYSRKLLIHTLSENIISYKKMKAMETLLPKTLFFRCHIAYIINFKYVRKLEKNSIYLSNGTVIPLSRSYKEQFKIRVLEYWGDKQ